MSEVRAESSIAIEKETLTAALLAEILPLAQKCWDESTVFKGETCAYHGERDIVVDPDTAAYQRAADAGKLVVVTLRDGAELKGYVIGILYNSLHQKKTLCAFGDSLYLEPAYRAHTWAVAKRFEKEMRVLGVQIIGWPVHVNGPVYEILKAKGYVGDDVVMEKRLKQVN